MNNFFTCGWKPVLSWLCVLCIWWAYMGASLCEAMLAAHGVQAELHKADTMPMMELVATLLGLGGIHSYDKGKGLLRRDVGGEKDV